jgi:lysozyme
MVAFNPSQHVPDVNHWQGLIDFAAFFGAGPSKLITKLTDGAHMADPQAGYALRWAAEKAHKPRETFHYLRPDVDLASQLETYSRALWGAGVDPLTEMTWLDVESLPLTWRALSALKIRNKLRPAVIEAFRWGLILLGAMPGCYTRASFWNRYIGPVNWRAYKLPQPRLWAADYGLDGEGEGITGPRWLDPVTWPQGWQRWQFTDKGRMPGVPGRVDLNYEKG